MASLEVQPYITTEQYLDIERLAETKSEYFNGRIYAMSGTSRAHTLIAGNIGREIGNQVRDRDCEVYGSDMRVKVSPTGLYTYPDVSVACGDIQFEDAQVDTLLNPLVIIEVLSPSTERYDRGDKFAHYRRLPSLQEYVLIAQDRIRVEKYIRQGSEWVLTELSDADAILNFISIEGAISLREIYSKVQFPADAENLEPPLR